MRRFFAATALTSLSGALLLGGVFAWRTSDSARGAALVGDNGFEISYRPHCDATSPEAYVDPTPDDAALPPITCHTLIGPNGSTTEVGRGAGKNTGDFKLIVVSGEVTIRALQRANTPCRPDNFGGAVRLLDPGQVIPPGGEGGKFAAFISVKPSAPAECRGEMVFYKVTISAENPQLTPTDAEPSPTS